MPDDTKYIMTYIPSSDNPSMYLRDDQDQKQPQRKMTKTVKKTRSVKGPLK